VPCPRGSAELRLSTATGVIWKRKMKNRVRGRLENECDGGGAIRGFGWRSAWSRMDGFAPRSGYAGPHYGDPMVDRFDTNWPMSNQRYCTTSSRPSSVAPRSPIVLIVGLNEAK
jgi:hypothetical protein